MEDGTWSKENTGTYQASQSFHYWLAIATQHLKRVDQRELGTGQTLHLPQNPNKNSASHWNKTHQWIHPKLSIEEWSKPPGNDTLN
jgi:hypothetical protein